MRDKSTHPSQYGEHFSRDQYLSKTTIIHDARGRQNNDSDEEFILQELGSVRKTTDVNITYEETSRMSDSGHEDGNLGISSSNKNS